MLDRKRNPTITSNTALVDPPTQKHFLDNGIPLYEINVGTQEVVKLEFCFYAGRPFEKKKVASRAVLSQLKEGGGSYSGEQIAEIIDFHGASLSFPVNLDVSSIILFCLKKDFYTFLPLLKAIICKPTFPQNELVAFVKRNKQRLLVDLTKNDVLAYRKITEHIFGEKHPYGYNSYPEDYDQLHREDLLEHYRRNFTAGSCNVFISGKVDAAMIGLINDYFGDSPSNEKPIARQVELQNKKPEAINFSLPDVSQTSIRLGRRLFNRSDEDYIKMYVTNTIFGGYFGSRLMTNIREEKGFTYNIYSIIDVMLFDGCWLVGAEVGNEYVQETLAEILIELERLKQELVSDEELQMAKNYLNGSFLTMMDGPFNVHEVVKTTVTENLPRNYLSKMNEEVANTTKEDVLQMAQKYLDPSIMWQIVVGS